MKSFKRVWIGWMIMLSAAATNLQGQVTFLDMQPITVGSISYLRTTASVPCCDSIYSVVPVSRSGFVLGTMLELQYDINCLSAPECETNLTVNTFVLGALESGSYFFKMTNLNFIPTLRIVSFEISNPSPDDRTLIINPGPGTSTVTCQVAGVAGARYVVETSDDLLNWTGIKTNIGAPFSFPISSQGSATNRYYRTKIFSSR